MRSKAVGFLFAVLGIVNLFAVLILVGWLNLSRALKAGHGAKGSRRVEPSLPAEIPLPPEAPPAQDFNNEARSALLHSILIGKDMGAGRATDLHLAFATLNIPRAGKLFNAITNKLERLGPQYIDLRLPPSESAKPFAVDDSLLKVLSCARDIAARHKMRGVNAWTLLEACLAASEKLREVLDLSPREEQELQSSLDARMLHEVSAFDTTR